MVSPGIASCEYTMNTLCYADRVKELNGNSKTGRAAKAQEPMSSSDEESVVDTSAISQVADLEKIYAQFQRANGLFKAMEQTSYNIEEGFHDLVEHLRKLLDAVLALQSAMYQERMAKNG